MGSRRWTGDDRFQPSRGGQQQVVGDTRRAFRLVVDEGHTVQRHDFECLPIQLHIQIAIGRGVHNAPELTLARRDFDSRSNAPIHGKYFFCCLCFSATSFGWDLDLMPECGRMWVMLNGASAHHDHTLTEPGYLGSITFHSLDDDRS